MPFLYMLFFSLPVSSSLMMSSRRLVPPVVAITFTPPMCLLTWIHIWLTCRASSLVGTMTNAEKTLKKKVIFTHLLNLSHS